MCSVVLDSHVQQSECYTCFFQVFFMLFQDIEYSSLCVNAQLHQSCPTFCDPMDCSLSGSSVHRILQARILEGVAMPFSRASSQSRDRTHSSECPALQVDSAVQFQVLLLLLLSRFSHVRLCATP